MTLGGSEGKQELTEADCTAPDVINNHTKRSLALRDCNYKCEYIHETLRCILFFQVIMDCITHRSSLIKGNLGKIEQ